MFLANDQQILKPTLNHSFSHQGAFPASGHTAATPAWESTFPGLFSLVIFGPTVESSAEELFNSTSFL